MEVERSLTLNFICDFTKKLIKNLYNKNIYDITILTWTIRKNEGGIFVEDNSDKKTILIVDDEKPIVDILMYNLKKEGYNFLEANDGETAVEIALREKPDLILLDIMLPKLDGLSVCRKVKNSYNVPIIMLSAKGEELDKILGLELGADDYITKPFSVRELVARVKANLRKAEANTTSNNKQSSPKNEIDKKGKITVGELELDLDKFEVKVRGNVIELTIREFEVLKFLAMQPSQVVTREVLLEKVWGYEYFGDIRTVDVTVRRIREKIERDTSNPKILVTKRGVGYYIANPN